MTDREIWKNSINLEPVDRMLFWPKLSDANFTYWKEGFGFSNLEAFFEYVGGTRLIYSQSSVKSINSMCTLTVTKNGDYEITSIETPIGSIQTTYQYDKPSAAWHPTEYFIKEKNDLDVLRFYFDDVTFDRNSENLDSMEELKNAFGNKAFFWESVGESSLMVFLEHFAGIENGHYIIADETKAVEALFDSCHEFLKRKSRAISEHTISDMVFFEENTSTTLISPNQYEAYCIPYLTEYREIFESSDLTMALHMCGYIEKILPLINKVGVKVYEAFTSPPVGDTPLSVGRQYCPDVCFIGGTNASLWMQPVEEVIRELESELSKLDHHRGIIFSPSGVMPPAAHPDKIREVAQWVREYSVKN